MRPCKSSEGTLGTGNRRTCSVPPWPPHYLKDTTMSASTSTQLRRCSLTTTLSAIIHTGVGMRVPDCFYSPLHVLFPGSTTVRHHCLDIINPICVWHAGAHSFRDLDSILTIVIGPASDAKATSSNSTGDTPLSSFHCFYMRAPTRAADKCIHLPCLSFYETLLTTDLVYPICCPMVAIA